MLDELQLLSGIDIPIEGIGLTLRQPRIKDISILGEQKYFIALGILGLSARSLNLSDIEISDWGIFLQTLNQKIPGIKDTRVFMTNFLQLFFNDRIIFGPRSIMIQRKDQIFNIEEENFDEIRSMIQEIGGASLLAPPAEEKFKPKNKKAAEIAEKMKKARARLAKVKAIESGITEEDNQEATFLGKYVRVAAVATANSIEDVNNMTLLQLHYIVQTYLQKESYELELRSRMFGSKDKDPLIHWMMRPIGGEKKSSLSVV